MILKRYDKFGTVKILTVSRKQWYKNFENPSKFIFIVHPLIDRVADNIVSGGIRRTIKQKLMTKCTNGSPD